MARPRFSEMLVDRRRRLGLSVVQAAEQLKLKEQVLIAFEDGDFGNMPKSGYAQGMLSSYARYLGLNPRVITQQFSSDLRAWEREVGRHDRRTRGVTASSAGYQGTRGLLPTSGGYAGDLDDYATTSPARVKGMEEGIYEAARRRSRTRDVGERRYTGRDVTREQEQRRASQYGRTRTRQTRSERARRDDVPLAPGAGGRITRREVSPSDFEDDLRYGTASPYEAASTATGRRSSRNIVHVDRPNVRRRAGANRGRAGQSDPRNRRAPSGILGGETRRLVLLTFVIVAILTAIIIFSVSSCAGGAQRDARESSAVGTTQTTAQTSSSQSTQSTSNPSDESSNSSGKDATGPTDQTSTEPTEVEVSVASGSVSWVEIRCDGKSVVAQQVTGPWDQSYTVTQSITIQVSNVPVVTVTKNGETQSFETKASGLGTITIQGTPASTDESDAATGSSADASKDSSGGSDGSGGSNGGTSSNSGGKGTGDGKGGPSSTGGSSSSGTSTNGKGTTSSSGSSGTSGRKS